MSGSETTSEPQELGAEVVSGSAAPPDDSQEVAKAKYTNLCRELNMDRQTEIDGFEMYLKVSQRCSLEVSKVKASVQVDSGLIWLFFLVAGRVHALAVLCSLRRLSQVQYAHSDWPGCGGARQLCLPEQPAALLPNEVCLPTI